MHKRFVVIKDYIGSYGFRVSKGDSIAPGDTAPPEVWLEIAKQVEAGNLMAQGEGEEQSWLNLEQRLKERQKAEEESSDA